jgi:hypothetical protein
MDMRIYKFAKQYNLSGVSCEKELKLSDCDVFSRIFGISGGAVSFLNKQRRLKPGVS